MLLIKGDKIKLKKELVGAKFLKVGEEFTVLEVSKEGYVVFLSDYGIGAMGFKDMEEYFEKSEVKKIKKIWSKWMLTTGGYHYRSNGKVVEVIEGNFKSKASCSPSDKFDMNKGIALCLARIRVKKAEQELKDLVGSL